MTAEARAGFTTATDLFTKLVREVPTARWDDPGLGDWTIRDLVGHTARALVTIEHHINRPAREVEVTGPAEYYRRMLSAVSPAEVADKGRASGKQLGADPAAEVATIAGRVQPLVARASDSLLVETPVGGMRFVDYLPTRVFELTVHSLDLARALGRKIELPKQAAVSALHLLAHLASTSADPGVLLLAGTGRESLPPGYSVL